LCWGAGSLAKGHRELAVPFSFSRKTSASPRETSVRVDLNADLGEATTPETRAAELSVLSSVTSINIACGAHAGDLETMRVMVRAALLAGVAIGAHPGYADRDGMGRRDQHLPLGDVTQLVRSQISALAEVAAEQGTRLTHVKPHGALYNQAAGDAALPGAIAEAVRLADPALWLVGLAGSALISAGRAAGLHVAQEVFADRAYLADGTLAPRGTPGAVLSNSDEVSAQALSLVTRGEVRAIDGSVIKLAVDTICLHGDTPGAAALARLVRAALEQAGVDVRARGAHV
jgi:UPF0271 protein